MDLQFYIEKTDIEKILDADTLKDLFELLSGYSYFIQDEYSNIREKEKDTAIQLAKKTLKFAEQMISFVDNALRQTDKTEFNKTWNTIEAIYKDGLKEKIINAFKEDNGFFNLSQVCKDLLYTKNDYLYSQEESEFLELAKSDDNTVVDNFCDFLCECLNNVVEVIKDDDIREILWETIIKKIDIDNGRHLGSLLEARTNALNVLKKDNILSIPESVKTNFSKLIKKINKGIHQP